MAPLALLQVVRAKLVQSTTGPVCVLGCGLLCWLLPGVCCQCGKLLETSFLTFAYSKPCLWMVEECLFEAVPFVGSKICFAKRAQAIGLQP